MAIIQPNILLEANIFNRSLFYKEEQRRRLNRYQELWSMYLGNQWLQDQDNEGDDLVTINYCAIFVEKLASFLMTPHGNNKHGVVFKSPDTDKANDAPTELEKTFNETDIIPFVNEVWENNQRQQLFMELAMLGGITGDVFVKVGWLASGQATPADEVANQPPDEDYEDEWGNKLKRVRGAAGEIIISVLDSTIVFPVFDEQDRHHMIACTVMYFITDPSKPMGDPMMYRESYTRDEIEIQFGQQTPKKYKNALGEIPIVHIPNYKVPGKAYGKSDLADIISLQMQFNEKQTDVSDIINYHAAPITIVQGAKVNQLERGAKKLWSGLPKDAKVFNLETQSDLKSSKEHIMEIKQGMHELVGVPSSTLGKEMKISNTSGVAMSVMYQPLIDRRNLKIATYGPGLQRINRLIIKLGEQMQLIKIAADVKDKYKTIIDFGDPLPKDELIALQVLAQEVGLGIKSRFTAMKERGIKNPEQEFNQWLAESVKITEATAIVQPKAGGDGGGGNTVGNANSKTNNPGGKGTGAVQQAAKAALQTNISGEPVDSYRPSAMADMEIKKD
jgi:hypothetical protein